ncbi:1,3-beta-glucanosyltransferase [Thecaphora frezii]
MKASLGRVATSVAAMMAGSALLLASSSSAIPQITRRGKYLYSGDERFYIKGIAYQEPAPVAAATAANDENGGFPEPDSFTDSLAMPAECARDVRHLQELGVNTIRVYSVNSTLNHDACMKSLSDAGIYVILELALPLNGSINRAEPSWDVGLLSQYTDTIDAFAKYDNLLAVGLANEVVTQDSNTNAAPFIKAAARDIKAYLKAQKHDRILTSYASTDGAAGLDNWRDQLAHYLTCGSDDVSIDLYGLNSYAWCGNSSYNGSGYATLVQEFANLPVAAYLSEFGCVQGLNGQPRPWTEVAALLSAPMTNTFSGGIAFSYFPQQSGLDYGMVSVQGNGVTVRNPDWDNLRHAYASATPPATAPSTGAAPGFAACSEASSGFGASSRLPPTPDRALCDCLHGKAWGCHVVSATQDAPAVLGTLIGTACGYLDQAGSSCDPIVANGTTGTYGNYSFCDVSHRLEWAMSTYQQLAQFDAQSCSFGGNATVNPSVTSPADVDAGVSTCLARNPIGVSTPTSTNKQSGQASTASGSGNQSNKNNNNNENAARASLDAIAAPLQLLLTAAVSLVAFTSLA